MARFQTPTRQQPLSQFVPYDLNFISQALNQRQDLFNQAETALDGFQLDINSIADSYDRERHQALQNEFNTAIEDITNRNSGDLTRSIPDIMKLQKKFQKLTGPLGEASAINQNYIGLQNYYATVDKSDVPAFEKDLLKKEALNEYIQVGGIGKGDALGQYNNFNPRSIAEYVDTGELSRKIAKERPIEKIAESSGWYLNTNDGNYYKDSQFTERVTYNDLYPRVLQNLQQDQKVLASLAQSARLDPTGGSLDERLSNVATAATNLYSFSNTTKFDQDMKIGPLAKERAKRKTEEEVVMTNLFGIPFSQSVINLELSRFVDGDSINNDIFDENGNLIKGRTKTTTTGATDDTGFGRGSSNIHTTSEFIPAENYDINRSYIDQLKSTNNELSDLSDKEIIELDFKAKKHLSSRSQVIWQPDKTTLNNETEAVFGKGERPGNLNTRAVYVKRSDGTYTESYDEALAELGHDPEEYGEVIKKSKITGFTNAGHKPATYIATIPDSDGNFRQVEVSSNNDLSNEMSGSWAINRAQMNGIPYEAINSNRFVQTDQGWLPLYYHSFNKLNLDGTYTNELYMSAGETGELEPVTMAEIMKKERDSAKNKGLLNN